MSDRSFRLMLLTACAVAVGLVPLAASAQRAQPAYKVPHNSYGQPDFSGAWSNATMTRLERTAEYGDRLVMTDAEVAAREGAFAADIDRRNQPTPETRRIEDLPCGPGFTGVNCGYNQGWTDPGNKVMRVNGEPRTSFITSTPNGRIPARITPAGGAGRGAAVAGRGGAGRGGAGRGGAGNRAAEIARNEAADAESEESAPVVRPVAAPGRGGGSAQNDNPEGRSLGERCIMSFGSSSGPIMQPQLYNNNYQIVQGRDSVAIWVEMVHDVRVIRLGGQHRTDGVRPWMGDSIGHYEGDTLVVETTNYHPRQSLSGSSDNLKVTERFTRKGPGRLLYQFEVEDSTVWATKWGGEYEMVSSQGVYEYACHEGNYALEGILAGARAEEALAAGRDNGDTRPAGRLLNYPAAGPLTGGR